MARADLTYLRPVVVGRVDHAATAVNGLADERRDRIGALAQDCLLELARGRLPHALAGLGALEPIGVARLDVDEARNARLEHLPVGAHPGRAHRLQGDAVIALLTRDDLDLVGFALCLPVEARSLERRLVRLGAAAPEEHGLPVV